MGLNTSQSMLIALGPYLQSALPLSSRAVKSRIHHSSVNFHSVIHSASIYRVPTMCWAVFLTVTELLILLMPCYITGNFRSIEEKGHLQSHMHRQGGCQGCSPELRIGSGLACSVLKIIALQTETGPLWFETQIFIYSKLGLCPICS